MTIASAADRGRVEALDLLRGIAVLLVISYHFAFRGAAADGFTTVSLPALIPFAKYGYLGVQLFFVISGFVIAYSAEGRTAAKFAIARATRIYPAFVLCMSATCAVTFVIGTPNFETSAAQWLANLFVLAPALHQPFMDGAYWSIVNEITFYVWAFVLIWAGLFRRKIDWIVLIWIGLSLFNEAVVDSEMLRRLFITDQSGFFCAGLALYEMYRGRRGRAVMLMLALACLAAVNQAVTGADWGRQHFQVEFDDTVIALVSLASIAAVALAVRVRLPRAWHKTLLAIGALTYPLYLLHQNIGYMLMNRFADRISPNRLVALVTLALLAASYVVSRLFEKPAQRWLKAILDLGLYRLERGAHAATAYLAKTIHPLKARRLPLVRPPPATGSA